MLFFQTCFDWFYKGQDDLDSETQSQMFTSKVLKLEPNRLTMKGTLTKREVSFTGHIPQVTMTGHCFINSQVNQVINPFNQKQHFGQGLGPGDTSGLAYLPEAQ